MNIDYEQCLAAMESLSDWFRSRHVQRNEATVRLQLIDRLLTECLGWDRDDITCEECHDGDYADYILSTTRRVFVVEAKRQGDYFELGAGWHKPQYKIHTLIKDNPRFGEAIKQVLRYSQSEGCRMRRYAMGTKSLPSLVAEQIV